ncbi:SRPBCC family protein [Paraburkholderia sp. DHOC27]|uniref:SRPBCC family protein n=1 Tax=Paraburkholderia sp. DHOC27 TaxID=2303330 RepID=UPI000E3D07A3|nr:SRPBCC family protein [Paraburkholderia sp. DHOC27]RFU45234.1 SRPBCC family protein [Paraburkholderia sp. DHOC27]
MAEASTSIEIALPADEVWQLIGGFGSLPEWLPYIPESELSEGGRVRHLTNPGGQTIVERLIAFDNAARSYTYAILQAPFPVRDYQSTLKVVERGSHDCRVEWSGRFVPTSGTDEDASRLFQGIYEDGLKALANELAKRA